MGAAANYVACRMEHAFTSGVRYSEDGPEVRMAKQQWESIISTVMQTVGNLEKSVKDKDKTLAAKQEKLEDLASKFDAEAELLRECKQSLSHTAASLESTTTELSQREEELDSLTAAHRAERANHMETRRALDDLHVRAVVVGEDSEEQSSAAAALKECQTECRKLKALQTKLEDESSKKDNQLQELRVELRNAENSRQSLVKSHKKKVESLRKVVGETSEQRDATSADLAKLSDLTVALKRRVLDLSSESEQAGPTAGDIEAVTQLQSKDPFVQKVLLLLAGETSRLMHDAEMAAREAEADKQAIEELEKRNKRNIVFYSRCVSWTLSIAIIGTLAIYVSERWIGPQLFDATFA